MQVKLDSRARRSLAAVAAAVLVAVLVTSCGLFDRSAEPPVGAVSAAPAAADGADARDELDADGGSVTAEVTGGELTVSAAAGAGPVSSVLSATAAEVAPADVPGAQAHEPVEVTLSSGQPAAPVTLQLRLAEPLGAGLSATFAWLDDEAGGWVATPSTLSDDRRVLTAVVDHLSAWDWLSWQTPEQVLGSVLSKRVAAPTCAGSPPSWVEGAAIFIDEVNSPTRWCTGSDPADPSVLVVKLRRNRASGAVVTPTVTPAWIWSSAFSDVPGAQEAFKEAADPTRLMYRLLAGGGQFVPGGEELDFGFTEASVRALEGGQPLVIVDRDLGPAVTTVAFDMAVEQVADRGSNLWRTAVMMTVIRQVDGCGDLLGATAGGDVAQLPSSAASCMGKLADPAVDWATTSGIQSLTKDVATIDRFKQLAPQLKRALKIYTLFEATMRFGEVVRDLTVFGGEGFWQVVVTAKVRKGPGPSALSWWEDQTYPMGWETGDTISFRDGRQVACSADTDSVCAYSLKTIALEAGASPTDATALVLLFSHDGDGWPLGQTVMRVHSPGKGLTVIASTEQLGLPEDRALCDVSLTTTSGGGVDVSFSGCYDTSGDGTEHYDLSGARLSARE